MAAASILYQRTAQEIADAVRRLLNDTDTEKVGASDEMLAELVISQYVMLGHELGWDPVVPNRPDTAGPASLLTYTLNPGEYQTTQEGHSDVVAFGDVYHDQNDIPMSYVERARLEAWINRDIELNGAVSQGTPRHWTIRIDHTSSGAGTPAQQADEFKHRMLVYPAANVVTTIYWPRTIVDMDAVDPLSTSARIPFNYLATEALKYRLAGLLVRALNDEQLKLLRLHRGFADRLDQLSERAIATWKQEAAAHVQKDFIQGYVA